MSIHIFCEYSLDPTCRGDSKTCFYGEIWNITYQLSYKSTLREPPHDKTNKMACASSEDSDQPGPPPSLIRVPCPHEESLGP